MITFEIAKQYLDNRWSIIPVQLSLDDKGKVQKKPVIAWREYQERLPTEQELHTWFDSGKVNAIGLVTGKISRLVVVDVDTTEHLFRSPMMVKTISGGTHSYYRWTEEMRNDAGIEDKPVDFRGDGGFVVLPPSQLGNQAYSWLKQVDPMFLNPVPDELKHLLKIRKNAEAKSVPVNATEGLPQAFEGFRNNTAAQVAGFLCSNISKKLLPLYGYRIFKDWNRSNCHPPLSEKELQTTWQSISNAENRKQSQEEEKKYTIFSGDRVMAECDRLKKLYGEGLSTGFEEVDEYFKFLPEQLYVLSSPTHQGKTTITLNMAGRMAASGEKVLYCSLEQGLWIAPRVESILGGPFPKQLFLLTSNKFLVADDIVQAVIQMTERPKLVVVDHLHFLQKEGKGTTEDVDTIILSMQNMAKELRLPVLVNVHVRKLNADRPPDLDDLRDSSSLSQVPSVVMLLYRKRMEASSVLASGSYLDMRGSLIIPKNRIQGKTGILGFELKNTGEFVFQKTVRTPLSIVAPKLTDI